MFQIFVLVKNMFRFFFQIGCCAQRNQGQGPWRVRSGVNIIKGRYNRKTAILLAKL